MLDFYNPPKALLASATKEGVELGGVKSILCIDGNHNFYNIGNIFTELSWAEFYKEEGLQDQIDTFTTKEFKSVRDDPGALVNTIVDNLDNIINTRRLFYGIADFEVDAFLNRNCVIPGLKLDYEIINRLMEAHKNTRDKNLFPEISKDERGIKKIKMEFQGNNKKHLHIYGSTLEDISERLRLAKGFATGIVCTSEGAANLYIMSDNIVFKEDEYAEIYIDQDNIDVIDMGIQRELLFPISWFRIDIGIRSLETLELWEEIKDTPKLVKALENYDKYITSLVFKKFKLIASGEQIGRDLEADFYTMTPQERRKALKDMADAIKILTKKYKE
ncbi:MAG: hypothetical protein GF383_14295 [Candidatus Lokiarchaeota archaeon]|nr:hypothetical protein [Candidatus Lokiarchaeota archaeon]MBD3342538.1 hypothetical protein [Candidatus Lokiarchaeota archaeon]